MEDDDPHQPQAPWPPRWKIKVISGPLMPTHQSCSTQLSVSLTGSLGADAKHFKNICTVCCYVHYWQRSLPSVVHFCNKECKTLFCNVNWTCVLIIDRKVAIDHSTAACSQNLIASATYFRQDSIAWPHCNSWAYCYTRCIYTTWWGMDLGL